ncbi:MAG: hypothetical protein U0132_11205 [Gemmatimonadaceae bacterium]
MMPGAMPLDAKAFVRAMDDVATLTVDSIGAGGDGVARMDGMVVFIPRSAPGDVLRARMRRESGFARGRVVDILTPGPQRVAAECRHYDADQCGGCQLQHLTLEAQQAAKRSVINDAMARIARREARVERMISGGHPWAYRSKLTLTIREQQGRRTRTIGLRRLGEPDAVFELTECPITDPRIVAAWREVGSARALLPSARTLSASIRIEGNELLFVLNGGVTWKDAKAFAAECPSLAIVRWHPHRGGVHVVVDRRPSGSPAASFQQVNPYVAPELRRQVLQQALSYTPSTAIDAYAGTGEVTVALHDAGVRVTAIEADEEAVRFCSSRLSPPSRAVAARVETVIPSLDPADVVILNPPRNGVEPAVTTALDAQRHIVRAILYVSCNPATLARDLQRLPSYQVRTLTAFDMFPQTAHVETLCELVPERV